MKKYYLRIHIYSLLLLSLFIISFNVHPNSESIVSDARQSKTNTSIIDTVLQISSKSIRAILEDTNGNFWFGTDGDGVYRYDGKSFTHFTNKGSALLSSNTDLDWKIEPDDLWFDAGYKGGVYRYDGHSFTIYNFQRPISPLHIMHNIPTPI